MTAAEPQHSVFEYSKGFRLVTRCSEDGCLLRYHLEQFQATSERWRPIALAWLEIRVIGGSNRISGTKTMVKALRGIYEMYGRQLPGSLQDFLNRADESRHVATSEKVRRWPPNKGAWYGS